MTDDLQKTFVDADEGARLPWLAWGVCCVFAFGALAFVFTIFLPLQEEHERVRTALEQSYANNQVLRDQVMLLEKAVREAEHERDFLSGAVARAQGDIDALNAAQEDLAKHLAEQINQGSVTLSQQSGQLVVELEDEILFGSGEAGLSTAGKQILGELAESFQKLPNKVIQVGGHTDAYPVSQKLSSRFATNWELSTGRAANVVRFLQETCGISGRRLVAAGFAEWRPASVNTTRAGRQLNRRIEITLLPMPAALAPASQ